MISDIENFKHQLQSMKDEYEQIKNTSQLETSMIQEDFIKSMKAMKKAYDKNRT